MSRKSGVLELAVLGLLNESPLHGYELSKRLKGVLGPLRAISYGSLYPCLNELQRAGCITTDDSASESGPGRRKKHVYKLTAEGKERLQEQLAEGGPVGVGRREPSASGSRSSPRPTPMSGCGSSKAAAAGSRSAGERQHVDDRAPASKLDRYTLELQRHGLESVEREVRWLNELIATERDGRGRPATAGPRMRLPTPAATLKHPQLKETTADGFHPCRHRGRGQLRLVPRPGRRVLQERRPGRAGSRSDARRLRRLPRP